MCEIYIDLFRQVGPAGAPGLVWISRSDKTHKVRARRRGGSGWSNLTHRGAQFQRMLSAAVRADNALFCAIGATVRPARMLINLVCSYLFAGFQLV